MRVAYFTNQYPKVSHSFIRREILALERQGVTIKRVALRGWSESLVDPDDLAERNKTHYLLRGGLIGLVGATVRKAFRHPLGFVRAMGAAIRLSRMSDRGLVYHFVYVAEACALAEWCIAQQVGHLHVHFGTNPAEVALLAQLVGGTRYSFTVHGPDEFDRPIGLHLGEKIQRASHAVAISSYGRSQLYRWVEPRHWSKIHVVHCGLDASFLEREVDSKPPEPYRVVCVGRLCEQKGQLLLIDAVRKLKEKGVILQLVLAGDGEMRREIEDFVLMHQLDRQVSITGWISSERVQQELLASQLLVLASFAEGLPVVIMEAMAMGRPVLTTGIAGIPELVRHGVDGWIVPPGDVVALADALEAALASAPDRLLAMGQAARERVRGRHSIDTEAAKLRLLFGAEA